MHTVGGIGTSKPTHRAAVDLRLRPHGHRDLPQSRTVQFISLNTSKTSDTASVRRYSFLFRLYKYFVQNIDD